MTDRDAAKALAVIRRAGWLAPFGADLPAALLAAGRLARLRAGQWTHAEGDRETGILFVIEGAVQLFTAAPGDREVLIGHAESGASIGQTARFGGGPRLVSAICVADSLLLLVPDGALTRLSDRHPDIWRAVASLAYAQLRANIRSHAEIVALAPRQRIAARLLLLAAPRGGRPPIELTIGQQALGELIGLTRKTVNRVLSSFAREGLVGLGYGRLQLLDLKGLKQASVA